MSNKNSNGMNKVASNKGRRGPKPIMTVAQLRAKLLSEMMVKELTTIDRKIGKLIKREVQLQNKLLETQRTLDSLRGVRVEYTNEVKA